MSTQERVGTAHDGLADLLLAIDRRVLLEIAAAAAGVTPTQPATLRSRDPRVQIPGLANRARTKIVDGIITSHGDNDRVIEFHLIEVELSEDWTKPRKWSLYVVAFELELNADGELVVFSPVPELRERIRTQMVPRMRVKPILVERDHIERITDYDDARQRPELAILGCLFHSHDPAPLAERLAVFRAAWMAIQSLDEYLAWRYASVIMSLVPSEVIEQGIEQLRDAGELDEERWRKIEDSERYGWSFNTGRKEGLQQGREEGREEGRRAVFALALRDLLELRGFSLTSDHRARIDSCDSVETLERWYAAAKTAAANQSIDEILR